MENDATRGKTFLGTFEHTTHLVKGDVYLNPDKKSLFIHRFYYDGKGPDFLQFVFVPLSYDEWKDDGENGFSLQIEERGLSAQIEGEVLNENLNVLLPSGSNVEELFRLSFWCQKYGVSFGRMYPSINNSKPKEVLIEVGTFVDIEHAVSGMVFIKDNKTLVIRDFNYDGTGPSVLFFGGHDKDLGTGEFISYPYQKNVLFRPDKLKAIRKRDITLILPKELNAFKMKWLSVWCDLFEISFGHVLFPLFSE